MALSTRLRLAARVVFFLLAMGLAFGTAIFGVLSHRFTTASF